MKINIIPLWLRKYLWLRKFVIVTHNKNDMDSYGNVMGGRCVLCDVGDDPTHNCCIYGCPCKMNQYLKLK